MGAIFSPSTPSPARDRDFGLRLIPVAVFTTADLQFNEPYLFDQPYSFGEDLSISRKSFANITAIGGLAIASPSASGFDFFNSASVSLRGAGQVNIGSIDQPRYRPFQILEGGGTSFLSSVDLNYRRDTTNPGTLPYRGTVTTANAEFFGALGGDYTFQRYTLGWSAYQTLRSDFLDRKTVLGVHLNTGFITGNSPFFERFYGGGIGSIRGFAYRGISPRDGREFDPVGGDFEYNGSVEVNFPVYEQVLRGVVFTDFGDVEGVDRFGALRSSPSGAGVRLTLPFLGQTPIAIDFGVPPDARGHARSDVASHQLFLWPESLVVIIRQKNLRPQVKKSDLPGTFASILLSNGKDDCRSSFGSSSALV